VRAQTGKKTGQNAAYHKKGQVGKYACSLCDKEGNKKLSQIVREGADYTGKKNKVFLQKLVCKVHCQKTAQPSHQTVEQTERLPEEKGS